MDSETQKTNLLVEIVEHLLVAGEGGPIDPVTRASCIGAYVRLCSLTRDEPVDCYITSPSTKGLYKMHLPANPEGFLAQLIQPLVIQRDPAELCALISTLNGCLLDSTVHGRVKLNILNVENSLVRQAVMIDLPADSIDLGRSFCSIRREMLIDAIDHPSGYFTVQDAPVNVPILFSLYRLYVDTERDLFLRFERRESLMPFFDELLDATRRRKELISGIFQSAIAANHQAILLTAKVMREKLDRYSESLNPNQMEQLDRAIEYGGEQNGVDIRGMEIQLANATFRGIDPMELYTSIQFVLPF